MSERVPGPYELRGDLILLNGMTHARLWHPSDRATHERTVNLLNKGTHYDALVKTVNTLIIESQEETGCAWCEYTLTPGTPEGDVEIAHLLHADGCPMVEACDVIAAATGKGDGA